MEAEQSRKRRRYSRELKAKILAECEVPGMSVAKVALAHGINANILHGWRKLARNTEPTVVRQEFVPVAVPTPSPAHVDETNAPPTPVRSDSSRIAQSTGRSCSLTRRSGRFQSPGPSSAHEIRISRVPLSLRNATTPACEVLALSSMVTDQYGH